MSLRLNQILGGADIRSPIFYDSNDTTYYFDGLASTSLNIAGQITTAKTNGTLFSIAGVDTIGYNSTAGRGAYIKGTGNTYIYGSGLFFDGTSVRQMLYEDTWLNNKYFGSDGIIYSNSSMRAPLFYDQNDTTYYIDPASFSLTSSIGIGGLTSSNNVQMYDSYVDASSSYLQSPPLIIRKDSSATGAIDQAPVGLFIYNLNGTNNTWTKLSMGNREAAGAGNTVSIAGLAAQKTAGTANNWATGNLHFWTKAGGTQITNMVAYSTGYVQSDYSFRSPIFYDSDNTSFYIDPANGGFNLRGGNSNRVTFNSGDSGIVVTNAEGISSNVRLGCAWGRPGIYNGASITIGAETTIDFVIANLVKGYIDSSSNLFINGSVRAPIFYDSNDTNYYIDAASTSLLNATRSVSLVAGSNSAMTGSPGSLAVYSASSPYISFHDGGVARTAYFQEAGGRFYFGDVPYTESEGSFRAPLFYDVNDTNYYLDPASTSRLNTINVGASGVIINNGATAPERNLKIKASGSGTSSVGIVLYDSSDTFRCQLYSEPSNYGFLDGLWAGWDLRKTIDGNLYLNDNTTYYLNTVSTSALYDLTLIGTKHTYLYINPGNGYEAMVRYNGGSGSGWYVGKRLTSQLVGTESFHFYSEAAGATVGGIDTSGSLFSTGSMRSPIFYDQNNTAYYCDPASTSVLNRLTIDGGNYANNYFQSLSDFVNGTLVTTDIPATAANGLSFVMNVIGKSYNTTTSPFNFSVQGYLYNSTIINYSGLSLDSTGLTTIKIFENGGFLCFWWARVSYWNAFEVSVRSYDTAKTNYNRVTNVTDVVEPTGTKKVTVTLQTFMRADVSATNAVDLRSQIFYDTNNTAFYCDPTGTSNFTGLTVANTITGNISGNAGTATTLQTARNINGTSFNGSAAITTATWGTARTITIGSTGKSVDGSTNVSWSLAELGAVALTGSTMTGVLTAYTPAVQTLVTGLSAFNAGVNIGERNVGSAAGFVPGYGQTTVYTGGYRSHMILGSYRTASAWGGGPFIAWGGNDNYATEYWLFNQGGAITHSGGKTMAYTDGTNASGSWGISVTGSSASCTGNSATTTLATKATRANGNFYIDDNYGNTVVGLYSANRYQGVFAMGDSYKLAADGTTTGTLYGIAWSHPNAGGTAANLNTHGALILENGAFLAALSGSIRSRDDMRTPIFYDSNNTAYYCDPASTSNLNAITAAGNVTAAQYYTGGWFRNNGSGNGLYNESTGQHFYSDSANYWNVASSAGAQGIRLRTGGHNGTVRGYFYADTNNDVGFLNQDGNWRLRVVGGDYALADGSSMRAQIFYDSNDTNYYINPASNSVLNGLYANSYNNLVNNFKDVYVYGDVNTYYIVLIQGEYIYSFGRYSVTRGYNWTGPDTWNTASHKGGLTLDWEWSGDTAWGGNDKAIRIIEFNESYSNMVAGLGYPVNGGVIIWLRGGGVNGAQYRIRTPIGSNSTVTVYDGVTATNHSSSTSFTAADSTVFSTRANTNNVSAEISARYPVRGAASLYNENNAVLDQGSTSQTKSGILSSSASLRAPIFYDTDDTTYLGDFASRRATNINGFTARTKMTLGLTAKYQLDRADYTGDGNYWTGVMGWGNTNFNTMVTWGSGFIDSWDSPANSPGTYSHFVGIQSLHYTNGDTDGTDNYGYQLVAGSGTTSPLYLRVNWGSAGSWRTILDSSNYNSYSPTLTGTGASGSWGISITGNSATVTNGVYTNTTNSLTGVNYFRSDKGSTSTVGANSNYALQAFSNDAGAAGMSFHRGGYYAVNMGLDPDNILRIGGWSASADRWVLDMSGNNWVASSFRAPVFYDSNDTTYYLDAANTTTSLLVAGSIGIGTTSPATRLHVIGTAGAARNVQLAGTTGLGSVFQLNNTVTALSRPVITLRNTQAGDTSSINRGAGIQFDLGYGGNSLENVGTRVSSGYITLAQESNADWTVTADRHSYLSFATISAGTVAERMRISSVGNVTINGSVTASSFIGNITKTSTTQTITGNSALTIDVAAAYIHIITIVPSGGVFGISSVTYNNRKAGPEVDEIILVFKWPASGSGSYNISNTIGDIPFNYGKATVTRLTSYKGTGGVWIAQTMISNIDYTNL